MGEKKRTVVKQHEELQKDKSVSVRMDTGRFCTG